MTAARGEALFYPFLFEADGRLALVFNEQGKGYSGCVLCWVDEDGISSKEVVSLAGKAYRPTGCRGGDGNLYIAYDSFDGNRYDVLVRVRTEAGWSGETRVNTGGQWLPARWYPPRPGARPCAGMNMGTWLGFHTAPQMWGRRMEW